MQEIVIILCSLVGIATAVAIRNVSKTTPRLYSLGVNSHINNQINLLRVEKDLLGKTISRLYNDDITCTKLQREQLLSQYQYQMGTILAKLEKLEYASKHPDLGPIGDGLVTILDQKLSKLDDRLHELSSKITVSKIPTDVKTSIPTDVKTPDKIPTDVKTSIPTNVKTPDKPQDSSTTFEKPNVKKVHPQHKSKPASKVQPTTQTKKTIPKPNIVKPDVAKKAAKLSKVKALPEPQHATNDDFEDDSNDIDKIKGDIKRVLEKLDQAEVE